MEVNGQLQTPTALPQEKGLPYTYWIRSGVDFRPGCALLRIRIYTNKLQVFFALIL